MSHLTKIEQAIDYIESHLKEKFSLNDIARAACMSPYHFHRVFQYSTGEIIGEYVRKRRLSCAAEDLLKTDKKVIEIALDYGFDSVEAFSRSFKNQMELSPLQYRKHGFHNLRLVKSPIKTELIRHLMDGNISLTPEFVELEPFTVVGFYAEEQKAKILIKFRELRNLYQSRKAEITCSASEDLYHLYPPVYGIDIWNQRMETDMRIMVGKKVYAAADLPDGMTDYQVEGGQYAVFTHKSSFKLGLTFNYIFNIWFSVNDKYEMDERTDFFVLSDRYKQDSPDSEIDIYMPIKKAEPLP